METQPTAEEAGAMRRIIDQCLRLDRLAVRLYQRFAQHTGEPHLQQFWQEMADDERSHVECWQEMLRWAGERDLPQLFDQPDEIEAELRAIETKCTPLVAAPAEDMNSQLMFLLAFKFEFYLLHPAFESLLDLSRVLHRQTEPDDAYARHISKLFDALAAHGLESMELELLGETIRRIWEGNRRMAKLTTLDPLTGVLNRRGLFNAILPLAHLAERNELHVAVFMVDVDDFKQINDRLGHQEGDRILQYVAGALRGAVRTSDVVGRYGGEEFLLFAASRDPLPAAELGEKILAAVRRDNHEHADVTVSIGAAVGHLQRDVPDALEQMIRRADRELLRAKALGKDRLVA